MPEKDTNNLPILDDIIVPGDADKAAPTPSSDVDSALLAEDEGAKAAVSQTAVPSANELETDDSDNADTVTFSLTEHDAEDNVSQAPVAQPTEAVEVLPPTPELLFDGPTPATDIDATSANAPNIDALTNEILSSVMPAVEQLLSEKIRQTLKQHLAANTDVD